MRRVLVQQQANQAESAETRAGGAEPVMQVEDVEETEGCSPDLVADQQRARLSTVPASWPKAQAPPTNPHAETVPVAARVADTHKREIRRALSMWNENPANFHQAACIFLLGGNDLGANRKSNFPRPENVSRMTNAEMQLAWEAASESISKNERLVCRFMNTRNASRSLGTDSPGLRAAKVGQGGGGLYVSGVGPHNLGWEQYQSGTFREETGKLLWGEKWRDVLVGRTDADKLDVVFFLKIPASVYETAKTVPGRENIKIIPPDVLYEEDGHHWLQKQKIVKSYVLARDVPTLQIKGEGPPPPTSLGIKWVFATLSLAIVLVQATALYAIFFNTAYPSCVNNSQCRRGMWCTTRGALGGRCEYCAYASRWGADQNATAFCIDRANHKEVFCDASTGYAESHCAHPACRACPGSAQGPNPGW